MNHVKKKIRVLYMIDSLLGEGGAELSLLRLIRQLPSERYECCVITFHSGEHAGPFLDEFPCPVEHLPLDNLYDRTALAVAWRIRKLVQRERIDIVHTYFQTSDLWAGPIAKLSGAKVLISSRRDMGILRLWKHRVGYRLLQGIYDQIHTVSESVRRYTMEADGVDPGRIRTIHNGIDPGLDVTTADVDRVRRKLKLLPETPVVIAVANWRHVKGIDVLVRAAALVGEKMPEAKFLVAGQLGESIADEAYVEHVQQLRRALGTERSVQFLGTSKQIPALLKLSSLFVLPSRSEGLSNALLEGMVSGLPCVATAVGGNPEVVVDGVTGFLVPADDPERLADAIVTLLNNPAMRRGMGRAGRQRVLERFTVDIMASQVMSAYEYLMNRNRSYTNRQMFTFAANLFKFCILAFQNDLYNLVEFLDRSTY